MPKFGPSIDNAVSPKNIRMNISRMQIGKFKFLDLDSSRLSQLETRTLFQKKQREMDTNPRVSCFPSTTVQHHHKNNFTYETVHEFNDKSKPEKKR